MTMTKNPIRRIAAEMQAGRFDAAERLCRAQLAVVAEDPEMLLLLAVSLHYQAKLDDAISAYEKLSVLQPHSGVAWGNYATALHEAGRLDEAEAAFRTALDQQAVEAQTLLNFGLLLLRRESYLDAREVLMQAHVKEPDSIQISLATARACNACGDNRTDKIIGPWKQWGTLNDEEQLQLASILLSVGSAHSALDLLEQVSERSPDNAQALIQLANVYERVNRLADAAEVLQRLDDNPALDAALRCEIDHQRATLTLRKNDPATAKAILLAAGPRQEDDFEHYFELAKTYDKLREPAKAISTLAIAHTGQAKKLRAVSPHLFEQRTPILPQTAARISDLEYHAWPKQRSPESKHSPIFVVGFPRSGTTLLEQMLDAHPHLQSMDERPFFNILADQLSEFGADIPQDLGKLSQQDCDELRKGYLQLACAKVPRRWDAQLVDKNPLNMLWLPMIYRLFPNAKWILALRHPCDVILSCYMQNFRANVLAAACANLERLASAYVTAMEHWLHHVEVFEPTVFVSRYENLVTDTFRQTNRMAEFLDLDEASTMLSFDQRAREKGFIATPSYTQVIQPVNNKGINRWRSYREYFEPVLPILEPMLQHWGYSTD